MKSESFLELEIQILNGIAYRYGRYLEVCRDKSLCKKEDVRTKIGVLIKEPGKKPRHVNISNTLSNLQKTVGGYIETVTFSKEIVVICNEEGRIQGLPYNCEIFGIDFVGTIIICGTEGEEFSDLRGNIKIWKEAFPSLWDE